MQQELHEHDVRLEQRVVEQVETVAASRKSIILLAPARLAETRDDDTGRHVERVQTFGRRLAERMRQVGLQSAKPAGACVEHVCHSAAPHDTGKAGARDAVLRKPREPPRGVRRVEPEVGPA